MANLLNFEFLVILNLFVSLTWPATGPYRGAKYDAVSLIVIVFTAIAIVLDIVFLVLKLVH